MKKVGKKIAMLFLLTFYVVFFSTGCLDKKINKTDYKLDEVLKGYNWEKKGNYYTKTIMSGDKYTYYFDGKDYQNNYFSIIANNEEIQYYYANNKLKSNNCEIDFNDLEKNDNGCSEETISNYKKLIFSFDVMNAELRVTKEDLYIVESEIKNKIIHVEGN